MTPLVRSRMCLPLVVTLTACSSAPSPTTRPIASSSSSASSPVASGSALPSDTPPEDVPKANVSAMAVVLTTEMDVQLFRVNDGAFAVLGNGYYKPVVYRVDDASIREEPEFAKGLQIHADPSDPSSRMFRIEGIRGAAGGDLDIVLNEPGERGGTTYDAHRRSGVWKNDAPYPFYGMFYGPLWVPLKDGNILTADEDGTPSSLQKVASAMFLPAPKGWTPKPTKVGAPAGCDSAMGQIRRITALGETSYAIGSACAGKDKLGGRAIESWKWGQAGVFATLPGRDFDPAWSELHDGPGGVFLLARGDDTNGAPYVARFDGKTWTDWSPSTGSGSPRFEVFGGKVHLVLDDALLRRDGEKWTAIPFPEDASDAMATHVIEAPDGAVWVVLGEKLFRVPRDGTRFEGVALPKVGEADVRVQDVAFTPNGDPLIAAQTGGTWVLLLPTTRAKPVAAPEAPKNKVAFGDVKPATAGCAKPFVVLYGMMKTTPDTYDFPLTRKALKGKTKYKDVHFFVTRDAGQRFLVARVPDLATGKDLVADIASALKDSKPQILCGDPAETIRELKIDLATGDVIP